MIKTTISQHEQTFLARVLARIESTGSQDRKHKRLVIKNLGMDAVQDVLEDPPERSVSSTDALAAFDASLSAPAAAGEDPRDRAMQAAINVVVRKLVDPFAGMHDKTQASVEMETDTVTWLVERLAKVATKGPEDAVIADLEDRFRAAMVVSS